MDIKNKLDILGISINASNIVKVMTIVDSIINNHKKGYITITGVHGIMESLHSKTVRQAHDEAYLSLPDGMPLVYIGRMRGYKKIKRCYGPNLMLAVMERSVEKGYTHFFYGGKEGVALRLKREMEKKYPGIRIIGTYTPPFRPLNAFEKKNFIDYIKTLKPNIIWVGLSTPKQELFMHEYSPLLDTHVMIGVGAAFDIHTDRIRSAPAWIQKCAMEWLYRLFQEPRRLWKRYLINNPLFLYYFVLQSLRLKKFK